MCLSLRRTDLPYQMSPPPATRNRTPATRYAVWRSEAYSFKSQTPQKKASRMDRAINTIWNAFSDILSDLDDAGVRHRPQCKGKQPGEKETREGQHRVDHLLLRN